MRSEASINTGSSVDDLCRSYLDLKYFFDPAAGSAAGRVDVDSRLGSFDGDSTRSHLAALRSIAGAVEELQPDEVQQEIDRTALLGEIRTTLYRLEHELPHVRNPGFWLGHLFQALYALMARAEGDAAARVSAVVARLEAAPAFLEQAADTIEAPPSVFVDTALGMLGGGGELITEIVAHFGPAAPDLSGELKQAGGAALQALLTFGKALRDEIEPNPDPHAFAIGEEQFSRRLHNEHALAPGPPELWRYGLHLQEEVTAEIEAVARRLGSKPWRELIAQLQDDSPPDDQLLEAYRSELNGACDFIRRKDLVTVPEGGVEVVPTPAFLKGLVPFAAYEPPPIYLRQRTGRFYVTIPDPSLPSDIRARQRRGHCRHAIPAMVAHEAYPGHHLQLLTSQDLRSEVRRHIWTPIMVEGWALYCEQLLDEFGFYRSDEARLFRLHNLLWRAIRIVLDVGLHTRGMSPSEAVDYMVEHLPIERASAEAEVRRYCAWPTYQLCYAVGWRELLRLRDAYQQRDPSGYTARKFHDEVMSYGGLPITLARWGMDLAE
ncbi:MAG TPA: DUF885 domain-containing protein [Gemmatimonadales bacterium]|nr:DUF885 domain-containing protein [Gemmatimonadales bacterium]